MKRIPFLVSLIILISIAVSSCAGTSPFGGPTQTPDPCSASELVKYAEAIEDVSRRFDDAYNLANNTSRMSLSPVIGDLQEIRRDAQDLDVPRCALDTKTNLVNYMDAIIDAFLAFLAQEPDSVVSGRFSTASNYYGKYLKALGEMSNP